MVQTQRIFLFVIVLCLCLLSESRRHRLFVREDDRKMISCTTFGFLKNSYLAVRMADFELPSIAPLDSWSFGFTLDKSESAGMSSYFENKRDKCPFRDDLMAATKSDSGVLSSERKNDQVSLALLRFDIQNPQDAYKSSRVMLSTSGLRDLDQLSLFPISEKEYSIWLNNSTIVPASFHLERPESQYRVYASLWRQFFEHYALYLIEASHNSVTKQSSSDGIEADQTVTTSSSNECPSKLLERAHNSSLGDLFAALLSNEKAKSADFFLPSLESASISVKSQLSSPSTRSKRSPQVPAQVDTDAATTSNTSSPQLGNLELFSPWFVKVLEYLRKAVTNGTDEKAMSKLYTEYELGNQPLSVKDLNQLIKCIKSAIDSDQRVTLEALGDSSSTEYYKAVRNAFRIPASNGTLPLVYESESKTFSVEFVVVIERSEEEGLYTMFFHNCPPRETQRHSAARVSFQLELVEKNQANFLSATEYALTPLNFAFAGLYVLLCAIWTYVLWRGRSRAVVFKIHYLMLLLLVLKTLAFLFHGINFYVIGLSGRHEEAWAVMYYITHLVKGAVLFLTVALIGAGWAFVKHVLSERDKKILMIVIPLQILANVAKIIIEESEESMQNYTILKELLTLLDLICCGAILFPIVWSIRHLQQAAQTDGKAALSLEKLRLFQHFYILVVCYIYFTRIMAYLIRITVSFRYDWIDELFAEVTTLVFFVVSGYKFRPANNNPYLAVPTEELALDEVAVTPNGALENVQQTARGKSMRAARDREAEHKRRDVDEAERRLVAQVRLDADYDVEDDDVVWDTRVMRETTVSSNRKTRLLDGEPAYE